MPDPALAARSPWAQLSALDAPHRPGGSAGIALHEVTGRLAAAVLARRGKAGALGERVLGAFGVALPQTPKLAAGPRVAFLWTGHEQWLALAEAVQVPDLAGMLMQECRGLASVCDQSDATATLRIAGARARDALARLCPIDLDPRAFALHDTARTLMAHMHMQITQVSVEPAYEVAIPHSFAESFRHHMVEAAAEFGIDAAAAT